MWRPSAAAPQREARVGREVVGGSEVILRVVARETGAVNPCHGKVTWVRWALGPESGTLRAMWRRSKSARARFTGATLALVATGCVRPPLDPGCVQLSPGDLVAGFFEVRLGPFGWPADDIAAKSQYLARMFLSYVEASGSWNLSDVSSVTRLVRNEFLGEAQRRPTGSP